MLVVQVRRKRLHTYFFIVPRLKDALERRCIDIVQLESSSLLALQLPPDKVSHCRTRTLLERIIDNEIPGALVSEL